MARATARRTPDAAVGREHVEAHDGNDHHGGSRDQDLGVGIHVGDPPRRPPGPALWGRVQQVEHDRRGHGPRTRARPFGATTGRCASCRVRRSSGNLPARAAASRRRAPHAARASRDAVGNGPSRPGCRGCRRPGRAAGRGSGAAPPQLGVRVAGGGSRARAGRGRRRNPGRHPRSARPSAGAEGSAPSDVPSDPRHSRRARGVGTTRPRSGPGREAAEGPARWRAAPAASRPRQGRSRAGSGATRPGTDRRSRRPGGHTPPCRRAGLGPRDRDPRPLPFDAVGFVRPLHPVWVDRSCGCVNPRRPRVSRPLRARASEPGTRRCRSRRGRVAP